MYENTTGTNQQICDNQWTNRASMYVLGSNIPHPI